MATVNPEQLVERLRAALRKEHDCYFNFGPECEHYELFAEDDDDEGYDMDGADPFTEEGNQV